MKKTLIKEDLFNKKWWIKFLNTLIYMKYNVSLYCLKAEKTKRAKILMNIEKEKDKLCKN